MKQYIIINLLILISLSGFSQDSDKKMIYKFDIKEEIGPPVWRTTMKSLAEARKNNADYVLIHMNTYGGLVDAADSIRTAILNFEKPVWVYIDNNAASAGALISISADSIYMRPGGNIGAATVVTQAGQAAPDKYQSYMRSMMRATCEAHGKDTIINGKDTSFIWHRNPFIAEAMVDPDKYVKGVSDSGEVLTMTPKEAMKNGFCEGTANSIEEVIKLTGITNYEIKEHKVTNLDKIIGILVSPYLSSILIMIIIGGIYFELQTPGIGFPLAAAGFAAVLYFAPLYLEGLAENWEIAVFGVGLILILIEIFAIPGFGVAGISGIILMILALTMSMVDNIIFDFPSSADGSWLEPIFKSWALVMLSIVLAIIISLWGGSKISKSSAFSFIMLDKQINSDDGYASFSKEGNSLVGKSGIAATHLRPSGKVQIEDELYDAMALTGYIEKGTKMSVIKYETGQLHVLKI